MRTPEPIDPAAEFHAHLDECDRCREHAFDLCPVGVLALTAAAGRLVSRSPLRQHIPEPARVRDACVCGHSREDHENPHAHGQCWSGDGVVYCACNAYKAASPEPGTEEKR